jgi:ribosomal protein S18 acetylase RimI-like enzyme
MSLAIRAATAADAPALVALIRELASTLDEPCPLDEAYARTFLAFPGSHALLAVDGEEVTGMLTFGLRPCLFHAGPACLVEDLLVRPAWRRRGVAGRLLDAAAELAREQGAVEISVSTERDNLAALSFYRRHGLTDEYVFLERHLRP